MIEVSNEELVVCGWQGNVKYLESVPLHCFHMNWIAHKRLGGNDDWQDEY